MYITLLMIWVLSLLLSLLVFTVEWYAPVLVCRALRHLFNDSKELCLGAIDCSREMEWKHAGGR